MLTYFIFSTAFDKKLNISSFCCNVCFYQTNAEDLNNTEDKIPTFNLYSITKYLSLCYLTIKEYQLQ